MTTYQEWEQPWLTATHYVYELWAADGRCLYVGCTAKVGNRLSTHMATQPWWPEVARIEATAHDGMEAGYSAETARIKELNPAHNRVHTDHQPNRGGWATRRAKSAARHERGEMCPLHVRCRECNSRRRASAA